MIRRSTNPFRLERRRIIPVLTLVALTACACGSREPAPRTVQPGAPGESTREVEPVPTHAEDRAHTEADVAFMRAMIPHHAQALTMAELVPDRTDWREIGLAAERIQRSQATEIAMMRRWLASRGEEAPPANAGRAPGPGGHDGHGGMHGMVSARELARLEAARGDDFDRLFLELMIRHHQGALRMTRELLATEGAAREPELFQFLSHIDADQRAEIARMHRMLNALEP